MKKLTYLFILFFIELFLPGVSASGQTKLEIKLTHEAGEVSGRRVFGSFLKQDSSFKTDSDAYEISGIWKFNFDDIQKAYNKFQSVNPKDSSFLRGYDFSDPGSADLVKKGFDNSIYIFTGIKKTGEYIIIPDINNNKDFLDDNIYTYRKAKVPADSVNILTDKLPVVNIKINTWNKDHLEYGDLFIKFIPKAFFGNFQTHLTDSIANILNICAASMDYWKGDFKVSNKTYTIYMQNDFPDVRFIDHSQIRLFISEKNSNSNNLPDFSKDYLSYQVNDSIPVSDYLYTIERISPFGDTIALKYSGQNKGTGISSSYYAKQILTSDIITNQPINLQTMKGQYVLLDFWGTWCVPCKEILPKLIAIDSLYYRKGLRVISIAYDKDQNTVKTFIRKENMRWLNVFQSTEPVIRNSKIITDYKVNSFPTSILIDPKGKIIFRGESVPGFEKLYQLLQNSL